MGRYRDGLLGETSAFCDEADAGQGSANLQIKQDWMSQVLDPSLSKTFPMLKIENWFEYRHNENGVSGIADWRATRDPEILATLTGLPG